MMRMVKNMTQSCNHAIMQSCNQSSIGVSLKERKLFF